MTSRHPPLAHIAGVLAAKEGLIPSHVLAQAIMDRLTREGFAIVPRDQAGAIAALQGLDAILALRDAAGDPELVTEWAQQLGLDSPAGLHLTLVAVRDALDNGATA